MLAEHCVNVNHSTIYRWVQRNTPEVEKKTALILALPPGEPLVCDHGSRIRFSK